MKIFNLFRIIGGTRKLVRNMIILAIILVIILGAYVIYPKRANMEWNNKINEIINPPDFECKFDSDCQWTSVGCYCATYGACARQGYSNICILPMGKGHLCEISPPPEDCFCIDSKCMTI